MKKAFIAAIIVALVALLLISGCAQQQPLPQEPQTEPQQQPAQPAQEITQPPAPQQQPAQQPAEQQAPAATPVTAGEDEIYRDNLNESLEELNQLE